MNRPVPAIAATLRGSVILAYRGAQYVLLLPLVFAITWFEAAAPETRENLARAALSLALMVAAITGTDIIRVAFV